MKVIWEPKDIYPGRKIYNQLKATSDRVWVIGKHHIGEYSLIDNENVIWDSMTKSEMAEYLTNSGYLPVELV